MYQRASQTIKLVFHQASYLNLVFVIIKLIDNNEDPNIIISEGRLI